VQMIFSRAVRLGSLAAFFLMCISCGDTFRPIVIPLTPTPPNPASFHYVISLSTNGPQQPGAGTRIDVSGDSNVGVAQLGMGPVHATLLPSGNTVYVADESEDIVSSYAPSDATTVSTVTLPAGSAPVFVATTENGKVYVANSGTGTVAAITTGSNLAQIVPLDPNPVTAATFKPIALAETPDAQKLYVVNNGTNSVSVITTTGLLASSPLPLTAGNSPVWIVMRSDGGRAFVLNNGFVWVIDTLNDSILGSVAVDPGGNFMTYDKNRNRIYVTSPSQNSVTVLDATIDPGSGNPLLARIDLSSAGNPLNCPSGCSPTSVTVLPDGSKAYISAYVLPTGGTALNSKVFTVSTATNAILKTIPLPTATVDATNPTGCGAARFRLFALASAGGTRVYVSNCDAGSTAVIQTSDDTLVQGQTPDPQTCLLTTAPLTIAAPFSSFPPLSVACVGTVPPPQNPVFLLAGP
jgi:DNA-binding beta-propeller fold protein YncE